MLYSKQMLFIKFHNMETLEGVLTGTKKSFVQITQITQKFLFQLC